MGVITSSAISTELASLRVRPAGWSYPAAHLPARRLPWDSGDTARAVGVLRWALGRPVGISRRRRGGAKKAKARPK